MIDHLIHAYVFVHFKIVYSHVCMVWIGSEWLIYSGQVFVLDEWGIGNCNRFVFEYLPMCILSKIKDWEWSLQKYWMAYWLPIQ